MTLLSHIGIVIAAAVVGAVVYPAIVFVGIKLNLKRLGTAYAGVRQDARFYGGWAVLGGALGAAMLTAIPILDDAGIKDPWYGLILIGLTMMLFWPMIRFLKRSRR